jgi:hypothetical protein
MDLSTIPAPFSACSSPYLNSVGDDSAQDFCDIPAGRGNAIAPKSAESTIAGGTLNTLAGVFGTVAGGEGNSADGDYAVVAGGWGGMSHAKFAVLSGGQANKVWSNYGASASGFKSTVSGRFSAAVGSNAR